MADENTSDVPGASSPWEGVFSICDNLSGDFFSGEQNLPQLNIHELLLNFVSSTLTCPGRRNFFNPFSKFEREITTGTKVNGGKSYGMVCL